MDSRGNNQYDSYSFLDHDGQASSLEPVFSLHGLGNRAPDLTRRRGNFPHPRRAHDIELCKWLGTARLGDLARSNLLCLSIDGIGGLEEELASMRRRSLPPLGESSSGGLDGKGGHGGSSRDGMVDCFVLDGGYHWEEGIFVRGWVGRAVDPNGDHGEVVLGLGVRYENHGVELGFLTDGKGGLKAHKRCFTTDGTGRWPFI